MCDSLIGGEIVSNTFGMGTGEILASNISCNGSEYDLYMCPNMTDIPDICTHERDAALSCQPGFSESFLHTTETSRTVATYYHAALFSLSS